MSGEKEDKPTERDWVDRVFEKVDPIVDRVASVMGQLHTPDKEYTRAGVKRLHEDAEDAVIVGDVSERVDRVEFAMRIGGKLHHVLFMRPEKIAELFRSETTLAQWLHAMAMECEAQEINRKLLKGGEET